MEAGITGGDCQCGKDIAARIVRTVADNRYQAQTEDLLHNATTAGAVAA
jgi:hypothetical protein